MEQYLKSELTLHKDYIQEADIAKFIIQAFTGPFHSMKTQPNIIQIAENIRNEYKSKHEFIKSQEIYQQISEKCLRVHIVPFLRKYKSVNLLSNLFIENFSFINEEYLSPIQFNRVVSMLNDCKDYDISSIESIINTFNLYNQPPHHSKLYSENVHPAYIIILNDVIKKYMRVL